MPTLTRLTPADDTLLRAGLLPLGVHADTQPAAPAEWENLARCEALCRDGLLARDRHAGVIASYRTTLRGISALAEGGAP